MGCAGLTVLNLGSLSEAKESLQALGDNRGSRRSSN